MSAGSIIETAAADAVKAEKRDPLEVGRGVLRSEAEALEQLVSALDESFVEAVKAILAIDGRVIVSGMGKSGHIARKIAASLASTGTPAQFVHPAEASHGDLGMLTSRDLALVLSNSGNTPELYHLIAHTRRFEIPLIGVASRSDSALMRAADIRLLLPPAPEACPMGLAPTTSTTMTLALGDALAVALMSQRDFTPEHFRAFHPGGALGSKLLSVEDLMHGLDKAPLVREATPLSEAVQVMSLKCFGVVGVCNEAGNLVGVISDGDIGRKLDTLRGDLLAGEVCTRNPKSIAPSRLAGEAVALMNRHKITCLFVTRKAADGGGEQVDGVIHIHDCLRAGVV